ncbi:MAG: protease inhibitor I42 family protein [Pseudoxanthomonas sp.]
MSLNQRFATACLAGMIALPGCATETQGNAVHTSRQDTVLKEEVVSVQAGETRLRIGQSLAIELDSNASTGYGWELIDDGSPQLVPAPVPVSAEVLPPPMPGAGGMSRWRFRAVQAGTTTVHLVYRRDWEKEVAPARTVSYRVVVE